MIGTPVARQSVPDQIFESTCRAILSGRYAPGEKLPTQRRLADDFGVNMATVREAVKKLEQLRLIEVRHGDAMRVRDWRKHGSLDVIAQMLLNAGAFDREVFANVLEARRLLLTECARLAATRRTKEQSARLSELAEHLASEADDGSAQAVDYEFYEELADASGNLVFTLILNTTRDLYLANAALFRAVVGNRDRLTPLYDRIAAAIEARDHDAAAQAARELTELQERQLLGLIESVTEG
jgi:GntR family transcriptional regulator, transcriptional repressor for pyruvate dehydrogenase complex